LDLLSPTVLSAVAGRVVVILIIPPLLVCAQTADSFKENGENLKSGRMNLPIVSLQSAGRSLGSTSYGNSRLQLWCNSMVFMRGQALRPFQGSSPTEILGYHYRPWRKPTIMELACDSPAPISISEE